MKRTILAILAVAAACRGGPAASEHTGGREFSVYNAPDFVIPVNMAVGREFTLVNMPASVIPANMAVGREFSLINVPDSVIPANIAVGREFSLNNDPATLIPANKAVGREFTGYLLPYTLAEVSDALRVAAGLNAGSADSVLRLNVVIKPPSTTVVDVLDAVGIAYLQTIAPPAE
jgi:hypothetical protein